MVNTTERPWSQAEREYAQDLVDLGYSLDEIAQALRRPKQSIATVLRGHLQPH